MKKILLTALLLAGFTAVAQERLDANTFKESVLEYMGLFPSLYSNSE